jgi:hypothetical protein
MGLKPVLAAILLVAVGLALLSVADFQNREPGRKKMQVRIIPPAEHTDNPIRAAEAVRHPASKSNRVFHGQPAQRQVASTRRIVLRLPYSNDAIETGTDAIIRIAMSQAELQSLGFPIGANAQDRRVIAELTLGDDGLPRAISLPLPIEIMKENK